MCYVTATELKNNLSYYLEKSLEEDVYITKNKRVISVLINPHYKAFLELSKIVEDLDIPESNKTDEEIICEEILKR